MHSLQIQDLQLTLPLGWTEAERAFPQEITLTLEWIFSTPPPACESDELEDTICYHTQTELIRTFCQRKEFRLLEHLAAQVAHYLANQAQSLKGASLKNPKPLHKIIVTAYKNPPSEANILGKVGFRYEYQTKK